MAFAAGSVLSGIILFFYFGLTKTTSDASGKLALTTSSEVVMENLYHDLRSATAIEVLRPYELSLSCVDAKANLQDTLNGDSSVFTNITYLREELGTEFVIRRTIGKMDSKVLMRADTIAENIFTGYVYLLPEKAEDPVPRYKKFDVISQPSSQKPGITLVGVHLKAVLQKQAIEVMTKVHLPMIYNNFIQSNWNEE